MTELSRIFDPLLTLLYPQVCHICQNSVEKASDGVACDSCWKKTFIFSGAESLCAKCGAFLQAKSSHFETFCHRCDRHFYDAASAVGIYRNALSACVLHLKSEPFVPKRLKTAFLERFQNSNFKDLSLIIPVPLSKKRMLERGFNQAQVLAEFISKQTGIPLDEQSLIRKLDTPMHRAAMDEKARAISVKNVFEAARPKLISGKRVLLIDDVFTSGATVSSCAQELKRNGAEKVYVFTLARTL